MGTRVSATRLTAPIVIACTFGLAVSLNALAQVRGHDSAWSAPPNAHAAVNPLLSRADALPGGMKVFQQRCAGCHGSDARGTSKAPDLTGPSVQAQTDGELYWKISSGNTHAGMPAFSFLPELQRWQLILHLRDRSKTSD